MGQWSTETLSPDINLDYSYYPAVWEDSGKLYVKAQGELDVNIYDIATNTWSSINLPSTNPRGQAGNDYKVESHPCRSELIWISGTTLYRLYQGYNGDATNSCFLDKISVADGTRLGFADVTNPFSNSYTGDWGFNRHKAVVKEPTTGRIFIINFYKKQIYEFLPTTETFVLVKTWGGPGEETITIGGNATDDVSGCDAVAMNGKIYLLGGHSSVNTSLNISKGPVEIVLEDWSCRTLADYPDYANQITFTYSPYINNVWTAIGNNIFGYGGQLFGWDGAGDGSSPQNLIRKVQFNPSSNTWTDLGTIESPLLHCGVAQYETSGYMLAGYENGVATKSTRRFTYFLGTPTQADPTYNPSTGNITISWTDTGGDSPDGFVIERSLIGTLTWTEVGSVAGTETSYIDTTADLLTEGYYYRVRAFKVSL